MSIDESVPEEKVSRSSGESPRERSGETSDAGAGKKTFAASTWWGGCVWGVFYFSAFASLGTQILGLNGHDGILPADQLLEFMRAYRGSESWTFPTLLWFSSSDSALLALCWGGAVISLLVFVGVLAGPALFLCWLFWLSLINVGRDFLSFQWDILLLEAGFISMFVANWRLLDFPWRKNGSLCDVHPFSVWVFRWLLFRLMFESGLCKLASGDPTWQSLTAMQYHFHTQPLPTPLAWLADKLPPWVQSFNVIATFVIELVLPFVLFFGRRGRLIAAAGFISLQIVIALTGNYAYFNVLSAALCLFLIDDDIWRKFLVKAHELFGRKGGRILHLANSAPNVSESETSSIEPQGLPEGRAVAEVGKDGPATKPRSSGMQLPAVRALSQPAKAIAIFSAVSIWSLSLGEFVSGKGLLPLAAEEGLMNLSRYYISNTYGLFATMTTRRDEIQIEGSKDGNLWIPYDFKFKPQDLNVPPCIVAPYQPRLDWQMWFAALGSVRQSPWFAHLLLKLFQNSPEVLKLFKHNPFPDQPPNYLRAKLYRYNFSDWNALMRSGEWWQREYVGDFVPAISRAEIREERR